MALTNLLIRAISAPSLDNIIAIDLPIPVPPPAMKATFEDGR